MTPDLRKLAASAVACFVLAVAGLLFMPYSPHVVVLAPAAGLALVLVLRLGDRVSPAVLLGTGLASLFIAAGTGRELEDVVLLAVGFGAASAMQAVLGAWLVRRFVGEHWKNLDQERDIAKLLMLGGPVSSLLGAGFATVVASVSGLAESADLGFLFWHIWLGNSLGVLVLAPLSIMLSGHRDAVWQGRRALLSIVVLPGLLLLVAALHLGMRWEARLLRDKVDHHGDEIGQHLQQRFNALDESVSALRRLVEVTPEMTYRQFEYFTRITLNENREISALSFNAYVKHADRLSFEKKMAGHLGVGGYQITERDPARKLVRAAARSEYFPVGFITPLEGNRPAVGFDINSEAARREAVIRAMESGAPAATGTLQLVQDQRQSTGMLVLHPAYRQVFYMAEQPESRTLIGFATAILKVDEMVQSATWSLLPAGMVLRLMDIQPAGHNALFQSDGGKHPTIAEPVWQQDLKMADRTWRLSVFPTPAYIREQRFWASFGIGVIGMLLIGVFQVLLLAMTGRTVAVARRVEEQTAELAAKSSVLAQILEEHDNLIRRVPVGLYKLRMKMNGDMKFEYVSPLWCDQLGLEAAAVTADAALVLRRLHPEDQADFIKCQQDALDRMASFEWEGRFLRGDEERWLHLKSTPTQVADGDVVWEGVQVDVTDRKLAEKERRLLSLAIAQSNASIVITDAAGDIVFLNDAFVKTTGYARDEVVGRNPRLLQSGLTRLEVYQDLWRTIKGGETWRGELQNKKKNGELYWEFATISPVQDDRGRIIHFIAIKENISDRKQQEDMTRQAKEEAEAANLAKSQFLATMSHEIRTPMNGILGMAQLLLMGGLTDAERDEFVRIILNSGNTLQSLLNDILDLSKVEAGKLELHLSSLDPRQVLEETAALFRGPAQQKGLRIDATWHGPATSRYLADTTRIRQMLSNLLSNAIKFTTAGHVRIDVAEINVEDGVALLSFSVTDTGLGIAEDRLALLFKPFSQVDASSTRQYGGTGLGLSIVRQLAELMGGSVGVDSQPGKGSRFWFRIRARLAAAEDGMPAVAGEALRNPLRNSELAALQPMAGRTEGSAGQRILVVEDNATNRLVIQALIRKLGYQAVSVENGQEAVSALQSGLQPALVLMDCQMPVMDGYAATREIRNRESSQQLPRLPIVALTAGAFEADRQRALDAGMDDFLTKPIDVDRLAETFKKWLPA